MPRFLYLMRHAQSAEKQPGQADKDRELTPQGMRDAQQAGRYLIQEKINLDLVISSTAVRARQTTENISRVFDLNVDQIQFEEVLYAASVPALLGLITQMDEQYTHVLYVGHNPIISYLAEYLTKAAIGDMPPAAIAMIKFDATHWEEVNQGSGELIALVTPENIKS